MAKTQTGPNGCLLVGPGVGAAIRGEESTVRRAKKVVSRSIGHLSESILVFWGDTGKLEIFNFLVVFDPTGTPCPRAHRCTKCQICVRGEHCRANFSSSDWLGSGSDLAGLEINLSFRSKNVIQSVKKRPGSVFYTRFDQFRSARPPFTTSFAHQDTSWGEIGYHSIWTPLAPPAGAAPQGRRLGLWRAFERRTAKTKSGPKGSLLVEPGCGWQWGQNAPKSRKF